MTITYAKCSTSKSIKRAVSHFWRFKLPNYPCYHATATFISAAMLSAATKLRRLALCAFIICNYWVGQATDPMLTLCITASQPVSSRTIAASQPVSSRTITTCRDAILTASQYELNNFSTSWLLSLCVSVLEHLFPVFITWSSTWEYYLGYFLVTV